ncbi:MAG: hypothetical protein O3A00_06650 [Planctomycetota bacterium]|nr:hypothetical protein [Planctomycetota bacterium]
MESLTKKQERVCRIISQYKLENEIPPTIAEIGQTMGVTSKAIRQHLGYLRDKGYVQSDFNAARSLKLTDKWRQHISRTVNKKSNPNVAVVAEEQPEVFSGWSDAEWEQLRSIRGVGGTMTKDEVVEQASRINENREAFQIVEDLLTAESTRERLLRSIRRLAKEIDAGTYITKRKR